MQAFAGQRCSAALQCPCPRLLVLSEGEGVTNSRIGASACMAETIEDTPAAATCPAAVSHSWPLTKDPSPGEESFSCSTEPFGFAEDKSSKVKSSQAQNPNPGRSSWQAGPHFEKVQRVFPEEVEKFVPEFVEDFGRQQLVGIVHRCRRWIDLCTPRPQR